MDGLGLLDIETTFEKEKTTCQIEGEVNGEWVNGLIGESHKNLKGYEIHMGTSSGDIGLFKVKRLSLDSTFNIQHSTLINDGSINGNCWGTYIHGIFENDSFRREIINSIREQKGLSPVKSAIKYSEMKEKAINNLADIVKQNLDIDFINRIIGL